jgi:fliG C-terminal domain
MAQEKRPALNEQLSVYFKAIEAKPRNHVLRFLHTASPLKAALVITCMPHDDAAFLLDELPMYIQRPILAALARGIRVPSDVLEHIAADVADSLQQIQVDKNRRIPLGFMDEDFSDIIIPRLSRRTVKSLLAILKEADIRRYKEALAFVVVFEDIMLLDDRDVQRVLKEMPFYELAAALITAPEPLKEKIKRNMSERMVARLEESIKAQDYLLSALNPEKMQDRIVDTIQRLEKAEEIVIRRYRNTQMVSITYEQMEDDQEKPETPFTFIANCTDEILITVLERESPHTAAVIISCLHLEKEISVLEGLLLCLSEAQQKMLLTELARGTCELTDCVRLIEADIAEKIKRLTNKRYMRIGGSDFVSKVINLMDASSRNAVFNLLKNKNTALYEAVKADTFIFEDIVRLSDLAIQKMMREIDAVQLAQALVTVPPEVKQKVMQNLSKRAAAMVEEEIKTMDMIDTKTVENAQGSITDIIIRLEKDGEIIIPSAK